jgi:hypothetical protein
MYKKQGRGPDRKRRKRKALFVTGSLTGLGLAGLALTRKKTLSLPPAQPKPKSKRVNLRSIGLDKAQRTRYSYSKLPYEMRAMLAVNNYLMN